MFVLVDVNPIENSPSENQDTETPSIDPSKKEKTCNCNPKTSCLRLHCFCFQNGEYCGEECQCKKCLNQVEFKKIREFVKKKQEIINPQAFTRKYIKGKDNKVIHSRGCQCKSKNNRCNQGYCECFKNQIKCTSLCKCEHCQNEKVVMDKKEVKEIYQNNTFRKKHKLVTERYTEPEKYFNLPPNMVKEVIYIAYVPHKNK